MRSLKLYMGLGLVISLSLFSCVSEEKEVVGPFKDVLDFQKEIASKSGGLNKTLISNEKLETSSVTNTDWAVELQPFVEADFNKPANKDNYAKKVINGSLSPWRDVIWVSTNDKLPVKKAIYRYMDSTCIGAYLQVNKSTAAYSMNENLVYLSESGYSINNEQDLSNLNENGFSLEGEFVGSPQPWRMFFDIGRQNVPVNFYLKTSEKEEMELEFFQGKESFIVSAIETDSGYYAEMPVFQSYLLFDNNESEWVGTFHNLDKGPDYVIPFTANKLPYELALDVMSNSDPKRFQGKWETYFMGDNDSSAAIGMFEQMGNDLVGTFATETGDYRFLQGKVVGDSFSLTTFDGSHLFLFTGNIQDNKIVNGHFYSGNHFHQEWKASLNSKFELIDPNSMTHLQDGVDEVNFSFPNLDGDLVSLKDEKYKNKVIILQILGSWCPNCMDETRYFKELYETYGPEKLEIIGLAFERSKEFEKAKVSLEKSIKDLNVPYEMLIAGTPRESGKALPMITPIKSYPTSIFINKKGEVVKIHTGFYGPSTGKYYDDYRAETEQFIEQLINE